MGVYGGLWSLVLGLRCLLESGRHTSHPRLALVYLYTGTGCSDFSQEVRAPAQRCYVVFFIFGALSMSSSSDWRPLGANGTAGVFRVFLVYTSTKHCCTTQG